MKRSKIGLVICFEDFDDFDIRIFKAVKNNSLKSKS